MAKKETRIARKYTWCEPCRVRGPHESGYLYTAKYGQVLQSTLLKEQQQFHYKIVHFNAIGIFRGDLSVERQGGIEFKYEDEMVIMGNIELCFDRKIYADIWEYERMWKYWTSIDRDYVRGGLCFHDFLEQRAIVNIGGPDAKKEEDQKEAAKESCIGDQ